MKILSVFSRLRSPNQVGFFGQMFSFQGPFLSTFLRMGLDFREEE